MSELLDDEVAEFDQPLSSDNRLRALLFLVDKKLQQKRRLQFDIYAVLGVLIAICLLLILGSVGSLQKGAPRFKADVSSVLFVLAPFLMVFLHYLWITFAQIYYRSLTVVDELLETSDFEEFSPIIHKELLDDDGSLLSQLRNLFTVDIGLTSTLFRVAGVACALLPVVVQALVSASATILLWHDNIALAVGVVVFYALSLMLAVLKTWSLYRFVRRMR